MTDEIATLPEPVLSEAEGVARNDNKAIKWLLARRSSRVALAVVLVLLIGCSKVADEDAPLKPTGPGHGGPPATAPVPDPPANRFNPSDLRPGDRFLGLEVVSAEVSPYAEDTSFVGTVKFRGQVTLEGELRPHIDYPGVPEARFPCFFPDSLSAQRLPRFEKDTRYAWFCFTNEEEAEKMIGDVTKRYSARIVVDDYQTVRQFSDVYDTATLVRIEERLELIPER